MKTWNAALVSHRQNIARCMRFRELLQLLEKHGAPPPDAVYAAHADWGVAGQTESQVGPGLLRVGLTIGEAPVLIATHRIKDKISTPQRVDRAEDLESVTKAWAAELRKYARPAADDQTVVPGLLAALEELYPTTDEAVLDVTARCLDNRSEPYHSTGAVPLRYAAEALARQLAVEPEERARIHEVVRKVFRDLRILGRGPE